IRPGRTTRRAARTAAAGTPLPTTSVVIGASAQPTSIEAPMWTEAPRKEVGPDPGYLTTSQSAKRAAPTASTSTKAWMLMILERANDPPRYAAQLLHRPDESWA